MKTAQLVGVTHRFGTVRAARTTGLHGVCHLFAERYADAEALGRKALALAARRSRMTTCCADRAGGSKRPRTADLR